MTIAAPLKEQSMSAENASTVVLGVMADTSTSRNRRAVEPSWMNRRTTPAVVVPVAWMRMRSSREPDEPAV